MTEPSEGIWQMPPSATIVPPVTVTVPSVSTEPAMPPVCAPPSTSTVPPVIRKLPFESIASVSPEGVRISAYPPLIVTIGVAAPLQAFNPSSSA